MGKKSPRQRENLQTLNIIFQQKEKSSTQHKNMHVTNNQIVDRLWFCIIYNDIAQSIFFLYFFFRVQLLLYEFFLLKTEQQKKIFCMKITKEKRREVMACIYSVHFINAHTEYINFGKFNRYLSKRPSNLYTFNAYNERNVYNKLSSSEHTALLLEPYSLCSFFCCCCWCY